MSKTRKLLPLAALFVLGVFLLSPGVPLRVSADVDPDPDGISVNALVVPTGETVRLTINAEDDDGTLDVTTAGDTDNDSTLSVVSCRVDNTTSNEGTADCADTDGDTSDNAVSMATANFTNDDGAEVDVNPLVVIIDLEAICDNGPETMTITASQDGASDDIDILCLTDPNITIEKQFVDNDGDSRSWDFEFDNGDSPADCWIEEEEDSGPNILQDGDNFDLIDDEVVFFWCIPNVQYQFTELDAEELDISCDASSNDDAIIDENDNDEGNDNVEIELLTEDVTVDCVFENTETSTPTPTVTTTSTVTPTATATRTPTVSVPSTMTIVVGTSQLGCGGQTPVTIHIRDAYGVGVPGVSVGISSSIGSIDPQRTTDQAGVANVVFRAPATSGGTAVITAGGGGVGASATIVVSCVAPATIVISAPPPPAAPVEPEVVRIIPPSTGDGGLLRDDWRTYAGLALVLASMAGAVAVVRVRA